MGEPTLLIDGTFALVHAAILAFVGRMLWTRPIPSEARRANQLFATWWTALAGVVALLGALHVLAAFDALDVSTYLASIYLSLFAVCVAMWGLLYYLLFLLTGRDLLRPITAFYVVLYFALVYYVSWSQPVALQVAPWQVKLTYAREPSGWPLATMVALLVGPHILGAIGYFSLFFRVHDPGQRYRIALVAGSIVAWAVAVVLSSELEITHTSTWAIASRLLGLGAALTILLAYRPPAWVRRRLDPVAAA